MVHADAVRCKGIQDEFPIETSTKWTLGLGYPEVIIRTDGESSILLRRAQELEQNSEKPVSRQRKTQAQCMTADQQDTQRVVSEL